MLFFFQNYKNIFQAGELFVDRKLFVRAKNAYSLSSWKKPWEQFFWRRGSKRKVTLFSWLQILVRGKKVIRDFVKTVGSYKYYACQYLDMLFDTADDRMCDYEALERDYYDTEYLKPKYLDNYWKIFTKENATNEAIKAVIDSGTIGSQSDLNKVILITSGKDFFRKYLYVRKWCFLKKNECHFDLRYHSTFLMLYISLISNHWKQCGNLPWCRQLEIPR